MEMHIRKNSVIDLKVGQSSRFAGPGINVLGGDAKFSMFIFCGFRIVGKEGRASPGGLLPKSQLKKQHHHSRH
jgi:hypothetical protein